MEIEFSCKFDAYPNNDIMDSFSSGIVFVFAALLAFRPCSSWSQFYLYSYWVDNFNKITMSIPCVLPSLKMQY